MEYAAFVISILALLFTVFSFWWMNWRRGKLSVGGPRSYAAQNSNDAGMILDLPFVFFNDGPTPIFVQNLRLQFVNETHPRPLNFVATVTKLANSEGRAMATQFPLLGRQAQLIICQFHRKPSGMIFEARNYPLELQAKLNNDNKWITVCRFTLNVSDTSAPIISKQFIAHDNMTDSS